MIYHAVKHTPSAFNSQSARVVVLLENNMINYGYYERNVTKIVPENNFAPTEEK